jgi:hypothetical protein
VQSTEHGVSSYFTVVEIEHASVPCQFVISDLLNLRWSSCPGFQEVTSDREQIVDWTLGGKKPLGVTATFDGQSHDVQLTR